MVGVPPPAAGATAEAGRSRDGGTAEPGRVKGIVAAGVAGCSGRAPTCGGTGPPGRMLGRVSGMVVA